ncbi:MAG: zinc ribbon domain-containing protein [Gemmatimonadota bacterium]|nr:zinc ribbon domain-containing protein [Gemmatimonadota bacterium]
MEREYRCPVCNEIIDRDTKMCPACRRVIRSTFLSRYYRPLVFALVLVNTALIIFLMVYIWIYGLGSSMHGSSDPGEEGRGRGVIEQLATEMLAQ